MLPAQNGEQRLAKDSTLLWMADFPAGLYYLLNYFLIFLLNKDGQFCLNAENLYM